MRSAAGQAVLKSRNLQLRHRWPGYMELQLRTTKSHEFWFARHQLQPLGASTSTYQNLRPILPSRIRLVFETGIKLIVVGLMRSSQLSS